MPFLANGGRVSMASTTLKISEIAMGAICFNASLPPNFTKVGIDTLTERDFCAHGTYPIAEMFRRSFISKIYKFVYPSLVLLTVIATVFVVLVLTRKNMRTSTNVVLLYMAVADLFVALVPFPFVFIYTILGNYKDKLSMKRSWCYLALYSTDALPPLGHNIAIWLTVLLATQRLIYIRWPLKSRTICTIRNIQTVTVVIVLVSFVFTLPKFIDIAHLDVATVWMQGPHEVLRDKVCILKQADFVVETIGEASFYGFNYWTRVIFFVLIPSVILVVVSILLIRGLREASERKHLLLATHRHRDARRQGESSATTSMLVLIVVIFLLVNLPQGMILAMVCICSAFNLDMGNTDQLLNITTVDNMLILLTFPVNFAIYCSMSAQFRQTFRRLFLRRAEGIAATGTPRLQSSRRGSEGIYYRINGAVHSESPSVMTHEHLISHSPMPERADHPVSTEHNL